MLNTVANPMGYLSNKPLVNSLSPLAQKQRSGLTLPPQVEIYLERQMRRAEQICVQSSPILDRNVSRALRVIRKARIPSVDSIQVPPNAPVLVHGNWKQGIVPVAKIWDLNIEDIRRRLDKNPELTPSLAVVQSFLRAITSLGK